MKASRKKTYPTMPFESVTTHYLTDLKLKKPNTYLLLREEKRRTKETSRLVLKKSGLSDGRIVTRCHFISRNSLPTGASVSNKNVIPMKVSRK
ncbi:hypothetical protein NPIL_610361 [Nephila pilipes]|uniref:Uncharacterized protein n=1 Tax=Nephila pilipes TaxID=299642 RepID=A0A8X6MKX7_NEPPI|nr:hypothetical protein NPIL_307471 [Nephila pilipes]GFT10340.1 hypothetical protein NPIL_610361 [Nephila pilipes]